MQNLEEMRDLILLGMLPTTTEQQVASPSLEKVSYLDS